MRYEITILTPEPADTLIEQLFNDHRYEKLEDWGKYFRLTYPLQGHDYAYRYGLTTNADDQRQRLLAYYLQQQAWVLRYLIVKAENSQERRTM